MTTTIIRIAKGATQAQLIRAADEVGAKVLSEGDETMGWLLQIVPNDKSRKFFGALCRIVIGDRITSVYPNPIDSCF